MSTTFGIPLRVIDDRVLLNAEGELEDYIDVSFFTPVWFRGNGGGDRWMNQLGVNLPDRQRVYALDNSAQGIYTIRDIKDFIETKYKDL